MDYNTMNDRLKLALDLKAVDEFSLYHAFEQVQDRRQKRGVRYSVALVLTLIVLSKLAGMTTLAATAKSGAPAGRHLEPAFAHEARDVSVCGDL